MTSDHPIAELLSDRLHHDAPLVDLPDRHPGRAVARAKVRRRNRRAGLAGAATLLVGVAAAVPVLRGSHDVEGDVATASTGLVPTGPLHLDWQRHAGGPGESMAIFQDGQDLIYALSTAPGSRPSNESSPRTVYRLGADGAWQLQDLAGDTSAGGPARAVDLAGAGGLLYAVSTGPAAGDPSAAQLSRSDDGGATWTTDDLPPVAPPSTTVEWSRRQTLAVESQGPTTLALVTTNFALKTPEALFPEMTTSSDILQVEPHEDGLALVRYEGDGRMVQIDPHDPGQGEVVRTVPWSDLGVDGGADALARSEIFRAGDDGWASLGSPGGAYENLTVAGGRFVALSSAAEVGPPAASTARVSEDGSSWSDLALPAPGQVVGLTDVLVDVPDDFTGTLQASSDGGENWEAVDLTGAGIGEEDIVTAVSGGPLGLALVTVDPDGTEQQLTVSADLVDWTTTPLPEVTGLDGRVMASVFVGADRIVLRAAPYGDGDEATPPPETVTAVATPARAG
jgi:hypothetical protein